MKPNADTVSESVAVGKSASSEVLDFYSSLHNRAERDLPVSVLCF